MNRSLSNPWLRGLLTLAVVCAGCRSAKVHRDPEYAQLAIESSRALGNPTAAAAAVAPVVPQLEGVHQVDEYVAFALEQNPRVQSARKQVEAQANRVPQAASLDNPMLGVNGYPFFPAVLQTAGGRSTFNVTASQKLPWFGKLATKARAAEADTNRARAELAAAELEVIEQVKRAYFELYFLQKAIEVTQESRQLLSELVRLADAQYRASLVSQQDVLRAQVEVSIVDNELIRLRQELQSGQARLAALLHVSPDTQLRAIGRLAPQQIPDDLQRLYQRAIVARPELHAQLAAIQRDQHQADLARLQFYPDLDLGAMYGGMTTRGAISPNADGIGMVNIGANIDVPIYRAKLVAGVRSAEAQAVSSAREYDSMKDRTQQDVKDLFVQARSQQDLLHLLETDIIPKIAETLAASRQAYEVREVDFQQLLDNWREVLRYRITYFRLEAQLRQTISTLERTVGGQLETGPTRHDATTPQGDSRPVPPLPPPAAARPLPGPPLAAQQPQRP